MNLGRVPYAPAWDLQRSLAAAVSQGAVPDTVLLLEHLPVITLGRRTEEGELHVPDGRGRDRRHGPRREVDLPRAGPARLLPDPRPDPARAGREALLPRPRGGADPRVARREVEATRIEGLTGIWIEDAIPRKIASIGVHITKWVTTHGYALNVDLDTAPFTQWITACGLADASFTTIATELDRPVTVDELRPHAVSALEEVFDLTFDELPVEDGAGLWPQPLHERLTAKPTGATSSGTTQGVEQVAAR